LSTELSTPIPLGNYMRVPGAEIDAPPGFPLSSFVYLIGPPDGPYKIGRAVDLRRRHVNLQAGSPVPIAARHWWLMSGPQATRMEHDMHRLFRWAKRHGEWFDADLSLLIQAGDLHMRGRVEDAMDLIDRCQPSPPKSPALVLRAYKRARGVA
jgi:hypothetical protein